MALGYFIKLLGTLLDSIYIGKGTSGDKIIFANNADANKPAIKYKDADDKWQYSNDGVAFYDMGSGGGGGEANTASNVGVGGVGLFNSKVGIDLQFKNLNAASNKVTVTDDPTNKEVDFDIVPSNISHTGLADKGTNTHATIDSHLSSTSNPHSVTKSQVSLGNVTDDSQLKRAASDFSTFTEKTSGSDNDLLLLEDSDDSYNKKKIKKANLIVGGGGGEANTASNIGVGGVGLFNSKVGVDLQFKNLIAGSNKITITNDPTDKEVEVDITPSNISHTDLADKGTNTHSTIDSHLSSTSNPHSVTKTQVSLGNVTDDAQLKRSANDIFSFTEKVVPVSNDIIIIEDSVDSYLKKKVKVGNLPGGGGGSDWSYIPTGLPTGFGGSSLAHYNLDGTVNELNDRINSYHLTVGTGSTRRQKMGGLVGHLFYTDYYLIANGTDDALRLVGDITIQLLLVQNEIYVNKYIMGCAASGETQAANVNYAVLFSGSYFKLRYIAEYGTSGTNIDYTSNAMLLVGPVVQLVTMTRISDQVYFYINDYCVSNSSGLHAPDKAESGNIQKLSFGCDPATLGSSGWTGILMSARVLDGAFTDAMVAEVYESVKP